MGRLLAAILDTATKNTEQKADKLRIEIYVFICLIGILLPIIALLVLASYSSLHPLSILFGVTCPLIYSFLLYLCLIGHYKISGTLASFVALIFPLAAAIIFGSDFDYELVVLVLAISPFIYPHHQKWHPFIFLFLHTLAFLICDNITISSITEFEPNIVKLSNHLIGWFIAILIIYEATAFFVLHQAGINEMAEREREIIKAKEKAEENDRLKSAFLSNMSHELRTPMNSIIGFSEYINQEKLNPIEIRKYAAFINQSSKQLLNIVNDVLDISKIETKQTTIHEEPTNLIHLLEGLLHVFEFSAKEKDLKLTLRHTLSASQALITCDQVKLTQILTNFLANAIKYTDKGKIDFGCKLIGNNLKFFVKDTGLGIAPEFHEHIFDHFWQVKENLGGTGLGLAISKGFVEVLGGKIWVVSQLNQGATFNFTLPYKPIQVESQSERQHKEIYNSLRKNLYNKEILIAEDELFNFKILEIIFKPFNANLFWAQNGEEAIKVVDDNPDLDFILMDIKMPVLDGLSATKIIKQKYPLIPIIAQSAFAFMDDKKQCLDAGCDYYVSKPIQKAELLNTIYQVLTVKKS